MTTSSIVLIIGVIVLVGIVGSLAFARRVVVLLTGKYLLKRKLAWVSLIACALCVGMVLVVLSVMSGWLKNFRESFKVLSGDVIVTQSSLRGFEGYEEMIDRAMKLPEVEAGVPIIRTAGLLTMQNGFNLYVGVVGLPPKRVDSVMDFSRTLWIQNKEKGPRPLGLPERAISFDLWPDIDYALITPGDPQALRRSGMIVSSSAVNIGKDPKTKRPDWPGYLIYGSWAKLTVMPGGEELSAETSAINARTTPYFVVDGTHTQAFQHQNMVYVDFRQLQLNLNLGGATYEVERLLDPKNPAGPTTRESRTDLPRTTEIQFKLKPGSDLNAARDRIQTIVDEVSRQKSSLFADIRAVTWEQQQAGFLNAVENEITIMMSLFGLISLVAVFMIFCIFYTIVAEKTRDIGILKSVGSSQWHIAQIFLTYGAAIGFVGGAVGVIGGWQFMKWINEIQDFITRVTGRSIYNSDVYQIERLPDTINWTSGIIIWICAIVAATAGALVPAVLAARKRPVESLRFE